MTEQLLESLRQGARRGTRLPSETDTSLNISPPATPGDIATAEAALGFSLPPLLRRVYGEVADGGFGPGYGLLPIRPLRSLSGQRETLVEARNELAANPRMPLALLPICDWGCAIWSCLDCSSDAGPIVTLAGEEPLVSTCLDLREWLSAWLEDIDLWSEMFEPGETKMGINPFTKRPIEIKSHGKPRGKPWP